MSAVRSKPNPQSLPEQRGQCAFIIGAQGGNNFFEVSSSIPRLVPPGGICCVDFDDDTAALPLFIGGRWNNNANELKLRCYCISPYPGGTVRAHYAIFIHYGPPS